MSLGARDICFIHKNHAPAFTSVLRCTPSKLLWSLFLFGYNLTLLEVDRLAVNTTDLEQLHVNILQRCALLVSDIKAINSSTNNSQ